MIRFLMAAGLGLLLMGSAAEARPVDYNDPQQNGPYRADMPSVPVNQGNNGMYYYNGQYYQGSTPVPAPNNNNYQLQPYPYGYWPYDNGSNHPGNGYYYNNNSGLNNGYQYVPGTNYTPSYYTPGYNQPYYNQPYYNNGTPNIINGVLNGILNRGWR